MTPHSAVDPRIVRLRRLDSCAVSDALDRLGLPAAISGLRPLSIQRRISGRVMTVKLAAGKPANGEAPHLGTAAIETAAAGDIIVVEQRTGIDAAGWGGILSNAARGKGLEGVIVEGAARDIDEAREIGFPVFGRSATARTARGRIHESATGQPIEVGEVRVDAGDYVIADGSGVVFIPHDAIDRVLEAAEKISRREAAMTKDVLEGRRVVEVMGASYEHMLEKR